MASLTRVPGKHLIIARFITARLVTMIIVLLPMAVAPAVDRELDRQHYREARKALARGQNERLRVLKAGLTAYPLYPYLLEAELSRKASDEHAVREYLARYDGLIPAGDLRREWLKRLADQRRWSDYLKDYRPQRSITLRCHALNARLQHGQTVALDSSNQDLWLSGESRPKACDPLFAHWRKNGQVDDEWLMRRAVLAVQAGEFRLAGWLARPLDGDRRDDLKRWISLRRAPRRGLTRARRWDDTFTNRRMIVDEIQRMTRDDADAAGRFWADLEPHFSWQEQQRISVPRSIALLRATDYPADAHSALLALPEGARDLQIREWTVRVALHEGDWPGVLAALGQLPDADQQRDRWRYWRARALEVLGRSDEARALYASLAEGAHYHGFLAAERLGERYALCPQLRAVGLTDLAPVTRNAAFERAVELFHVGQLGDARREFNEASRSMTPEQRRIAAVLADAEGWHSQAILTLADAGFLRQYTLRFPLAFAEPVARESTRRKLNPSFIYAVMRSESAMTPDAVSSAGALGLMQLTRDTARQVARRYHLKAPTRGNLLNPNQNIALGSAYLDQLFEEFNHPMLVLAAYNAGPEAVRRWQAIGMPLEADRWIETLPYHETRDYLPRVLAFATIYDWRRLGRMVPLGARMPPLDQPFDKTDPAGGASMVPRCPERVESGH